MHVHPKMSYVCLFISVFKKLCLYWIIYYLSTEQRNANRPLTTSKEFHEFEIKLKFMNSYVLLTFPKTF